MSVREIEDESESASTHWFSAQMPASAGGQKKAKGRSQKQSRSHWWTVSSQLLSHYLLHPIM